METAVDKQVQKIGKGAKDAGEEFHWWAIPVDTDEYKGRIQIFSEGPKIEKVKTGKLKRGS